MGKRLIRRSLTKTASTAAVELGTSRAADSSVCADGSVHIHFLLISVWIRLNKLKYRSGLFNSEPFVGYQPFDDSPLCLVLC